MRKEPEKCPFCGHNKIRKYGFALTSIKGKQQRWQCLKCYKTFVEV